ncbi:MAG: hypothetical protein ACK4NN_10045 [Rheinheimera sp.]
MINKMLSAVFAIALSGAALLSVSAQAEPILVHDFWGKKSDGTSELFATLKVDVLEATQFDGDIYEAFGWKSFSVYGQEILPVNTFLFYSQFNMSNLYAGLTFFNFDVLEELSNVSFSGFYDSELSVDFYTLLDGDFSDIYTEGVFAAPVSVVSSPASIALISLGFLGLLARRNRKA